MLPDFLACYSGCNTDGKNRITENSNTEEDYKTEAAIEEQKANIHINKDFPPISHVQQPFPLPYK